MSKSTVSRVISGKGNCKPETREKIFNAMKEMNYTPNRLAQAMVTKKTGIIGVIIYRKHMPIISPARWKTVVTVCDGRVSRLHCIVKGRILNLITYIKV